MFNYYVLLILLLLSLFWFFLPHKENPAYDGVKSNIKLHLL